MWHPSRSWSGWALGIGRLGGIAAPVLGGYLLTLGMPSTQIFLSACGLAVIAGVGVGGIVNMNNCYTSTL